MKVNAEIESPYPPIVFRYLIAITLIFLPFSVQLSNLALAISFLYWLISGNLKTKFKILRERRVTVALFIGIYLMYLIGSMYSSDLSRVIKILERSLAILITPFMIGSFKWRKSMIFTPLNAFLLSCSMISVYAIFKTIYYFNQHPDEYYLEFALWKLPQLVHFHAPYFALYLVIANICGYMMFSSDNVSLKHKRVLLIFLAFSNILLFFISSRTALFANWMLIIIVIARHFYLKKKYWEILLSFLAMGIIFIIAYYNIPFLHTKISNILKEGYGTFFRLQVAEIVFELFKEAPLIGHGIGDAFQVLQQGYVDRGLQNYVGLNSHNQYLFFLLSSGAIGATFFLCILFYSFRLAFKQKNRTYMAILFVFCICFLTEELLSRQKGIMLYAIFNSLLAFNDQD